MFQLEYVYAIIDNTNFYYNYANKYSGGAIYALSSQLVVKDSSFVGNYA